jgi:gamma-tubulin complex component 3
MIKAWIYHGMIEDYFNEFFIGVNEIEEPSKMWTEKYFFREVMRPKFLSEEICRKV